MGMFMNHSIFCLWLTIDITPSRTDKDALAFVHEQGDFVGVETIALGVSSIVPTFSLLNNDLVTD